MILKAKQVIKVTLFVELPADILPDQIQEWVDVHFAEVNSMDSNNPCDNNYEVIEHELEYL